MATVKIDKFGGIAPRQHPTLLADGMATVAMNVKLENGKLVPLRQPLLVEGAENIMEGGLSDPGDAKSVHVWRKADGTFDFLLFPGVTWATPGNVADDDLTRLIVSGERFSSTGTNQPVLYVRDNGSVEKVLIRKTAPRRPRVCRCRLNNNTWTDDYGDPASGNIRYTRFFLTWVDKYGMESPVSAPSIRQTNENASANFDLPYLDGETVHFFWGNNESPNIPADAVSVCIYKVVTGTSEGRVQLVSELSRSDALAAGGFRVAVADVNLGETLTEIENAPVDLTCIQAVPGSFYCGFSASKRKTICFSDVDIFYSWPTQYRYDVTDNIVVLAVTSNTVFALTDGWPYALSGTAPESMTVAKLASPAACVSPTAVCVYRNTVFYASNVGLMAISNSATEGTVVQNITEQVFTKDQWRSLNPETSLIGHDNGRLFLYFPDAADRRFRGLAFNFSEGLSVALTQHDELARCLCVDNAKDKMYFVRGRTEEEDL